MSMLSAQRDELCKCADALQDAIDNLNLGHITYEGLTDAMHYGINDLRYAADTIWELRNKMCDMVDARERARVLESENDRLRELCAEMFEAVKCCCGEWCTKTASNCDNNECGWHKCYVALRELGIEVR